MSVTLWEVVRVAFNVETVPSKELSPYSICESDGKSVIQAMVTAEALTLAVSMPEIKTPETLTEGAPPDPEVDTNSVVKVLSEIIAWLPISSLDFTR